MEKYFSEKTIRHPGLILRDILAEKNISMIRFCKMAKVMPRYIERVLWGKIKISKDLSKKIAWVFSFPEDAFYQLQLHYDKYGDKDFEIVFNQKKMLGQKVIRRGKDRCDVKRKFMREKAKEGVWTRVILTTEV